MNDVARVVEEVIKHLPNRHDQKAHGGNFGKGGGGEEFEREYATVTKPVDVGDKEELLVALQRYEFKGRKVSYWRSSMYSHGSGPRTYIVLRDKYVNEYGFDSDFTGTWGATGPHDQAPAIRVSKDLEKSIYQLWPRKDRFDNPIGAVNEKVLTKIFAESNFGKSSS